MFLPQTCWQFVLSQSSDLNHLLSEQSLKTGLWVKKKQAEQENWKTELETWLCSLSNNSKSCFAVDSMYMDMHTDTSTGPQTLHTLPYDGEIFVLKAVTLGFLNKKI